MGSDSLPDHSVTAGLLPPRTDEAPLLLVVDDDQAVRGLLSRWLCAAGYHCGTAASADEAWSLLERSPASLMTLDITMPGVSGLDLLDKVKAAYQDTEVIMLTALGQAETAIRALTRGASAYLIKPVSREELLFHVVKGLERRQLLIDKRQYTEHLEAQVREQTVSIRRAHEETIHRLLSATMCRDEETGAHVRRVGLFSEALALAAGWSTASAEQIRFAAPMHDVGKIGIPDAILRKPGALTAEEYAVMKQHTTIGAHTLRGSRSELLQMACEIAQSHHERWDGTGYPQGLAGEAIPESARIVAITDVYDALTHDRVYRPAMNEDEVLELLRKGAGTQFDPGLLGLFFLILDKIREIADQHPDRPEQETPRAADTLESASPLSAWGQN